MKKNLLLLLLVMVTLVSCHTREQVVYFQDTQENEAIATQKMKILTLVPGDKVSVKVTSATTPELAQRYNLDGVNNSSNTGTQENLRYTLDENGCIDLPGIGRVDINGLTRAEAAAKIQAIFREGVINDAVVTVAAYNRYITVLGEVGNPGKIEITRDNMNILEAIGEAGDLTITGRRDCIKVFRTEGSETKTYYVDLRSKNIMNSPVYNLQQNDVIYVEPNKVKMEQATYNGSTIRQLSTWLSLTSLATSMTILICNAIKK